MPSARRPARGAASAGPPTQASVQSVASFDQFVQSLVDAGSREHYEDAALYDYEYRRRRDDVAFYQGLAARLAPGRPVLDLGAGTGRLTLPLLRAGHPVVALDQAPAMLQRLQERAERLPATAAARLAVRRADLRGFALGRRFDLAIAAFNVVEHLYTHVELARFLTRVAAHLTPTGSFAFDVQMPDLAWLLRDARRRWARTRFTHPVTGRKLVYSTNHDYDPVTQIALIRLYYEPDDDGPTRIIKLSQRKFFPAELEALLAASGFTVAERYGDFAGAPLDGAAASQVLVCRLARRGAGRRPASAGAKTADSRAPRRGSQKKNGARRKKIQARRR